MDTKEPKTTREAIVASLVNFANRVLDGRIISDKEIEILPEIIHIILDNEH